MAVPGLTQGLQHFRWTSTVRCACSGMYPNRKFATYNISQKSYKVQATNILHTNLSAL